MKYNIDEKGNHVPRLKNEKKYVKNEYHAV